jgi:NADPH-dependent 2,4-dienoyl-CoA reductase/sulfur reductase-like enzyme
MKYDTVVIGGGPAGLAAAIRAKELGLEVLLLDEKDYLGGILPQCIHPGFGLHYFREDLTGPEFAHRLVEKVESLGIEIRKEATVLNISLEGKWRKVKYVSPQGLEYIDTKSVIYAAGAREKHRFEVGILGDRVAGVFTAGEAQTMMDIYGIMPGKKVVIVGSGDVGLIMARRFALEGAEVKGVIELMPYPGGLARNIVQCLQDFNIPLYLGHRVLEIKGKRRVERVVVSSVDGKNQFEIPCDTVVLSVGLTPRVKMLKRIGVNIDPATGGPYVDENLSTNVDGIFVAGNSLVINDLVDYVVEQGELAAGAARKYVDGELERGDIWIKPGNGMRCVVPQYVSGKRDVVFYARVSEPRENAVLEFVGTNHRIRYPVVKPAEMLRFRVKKEKLATSMDVLSLEVK